MMLRRLADGVINKEDDPVLRSPSTVVFSKVRRVADPMAQWAAAGMQGEAMRGFGFGRGVGARYQSGPGDGAGFPTLNTLIKRFMAWGMPRKQAQLAALKMIYAQNLSGKVV